MYLMSICFRPCLYLKRLVKYLRKVIRADSKTQNEAHVSVSKYKEATKFIKSFVCSCCLVVFEFVLVIFELTLPLVNSNCIQTHDLLVIR